MGRIIVCLLIACLGSVSHAAFEFSPIISNLAPSGPGASASFTVSNPGDTKIPVQVTVVAREPDEQGKETYAETEAVSEMFRIFPAQLVLNAKETRTIRLTYIGSPKIKSEMAFRVIAEELPVDVSDPKKVYKKAVANVTIAIKYIGSVYVTPSGAKSQIQIDAQPVEQPAPQAGQSASKNLVITVTNSGTAHQIVRTPTLKLRSMVDNSEVVLRGDDLKTLSNLNVLAGKTRKFTLDWPQKLPVGPVKASFETVNE